MSKETSRNWALTHVDLLSERFGGQAVQCNDEFFAEANNLTKCTEPVFIEHKYTHRGKWMDGWETRRRRTPGHDWCILRLGLCGRIRAFNVDTTHFKGNAPEKIAIEACISNTEPTAQTPWTTLIETTAINAHSHNHFEIINPHAWSHLRLNIFPDGGVARLRVYGEPHVEWSSLLPNELVDLAASTNGGRAIACSDMFFSPMNNLIAPGRGVNMGDGWETRRRRGPGHDWLIVQLACPGAIARVLVDTCHFKGNYPDSFDLEATLAPAAAITSGEVKWIKLIHKTPLQAHTEHYFQNEMSDRQNPYSHVRLNIYPDGGVSRLRIFGYPQLDLGQ